MAQIKIALAGNPNCGKTTMFNALTGASQYVGNWPGVTVEKKEGKLRGNRDVTITDLPGIYSLSPYTLEEVVSRNYLLKEHPDVVINLVDGSNIERNLYLTTQIIELGIPVLIALNMMDVVNKRGDKIDVKKLSAELGCPIVETAAVSGTGLDEMAKQAVALAEAKQAVPAPHGFSSEVEGALAEISNVIAGKVEAKSLRWYAVKVFERDEKVLAELGYGDKLPEDLEAAVAKVESDLDDDAESIITGERYDYIGKVISKTYKKKSAGLSVSDKIDKVVTNRILALPIFGLIIVAMYLIVVTTVGAWWTDWANDQLLGEDGWFLFGIGRSAYDDAESEFEEADQIINGADYYDFDAGDMAHSDPADYSPVYIPGLYTVIANALEAINCNELLTALILDGIVAGVGAVLGFVPQMLLLFFFLAILEDCGYMARIAFIMDRIFRRFGLSGKNFIPMLVATGCGIDGHYDHHLYALRRQAAHYRPHRRRPVL